MTNHEDGEWHREVITAPSEATLHLLRDASLLDRFYLAGGTGLASSSATDCRKTWISLPLIFLTRNPCSSGCKPCRDFRWSQRRRTRCTPRSGDRASHSLDTYTR